MLWNVPSSERQDHGDTARIELKSVRLQQHPQQIVPSNKSDHSARQHQERNVSDQRRVLRLLFAEGAGGTAGNGSVAAFAEEGVAGADVAEGEVLVGGGVQLLVR